MSLIMEFRYRHEKKVILPINATTVGKNYEGQYTKGEKLEAVN
tara:strand:- start:37 stop:165 length:129 start_codon:yes stop_codon:yes gene_type:complete